MSKSPLVSVVIPNFNNQPHLKKSLEALFDNKIEKEVILVDDASTDKSLEIAQKFPIEIIQNKENLGPVKSRDIGAARSHGQYILFLDADAKIEPDYIEKLVNFFESHPQTGIVSGRVSELGQEDRMWFNFGYEPSPLRDSIAAIFHQKILKFWHIKMIRNIISVLAIPFTLNMINDKLLAVDWVIEMAFMVRKDLFNKVGGFDEKFFMFQEGPDLCNRIRSLGFKVYYLPTAQVHHLGGHSHSSQKRIQMKRDSVLYYYQKHPRIF